MRNHQPVQTFAETQLVATRLIADLSMLEPCRGNPYLPSIAQAIAALDPSLSAAKVLAAWPHPDKGQPVFHGNPLLPLLENLGYRATRLSGPPNHATWPTNPTRIVWRLGEMVRIYNADGTEAWEAPTGQTSTKKIKKGEWWRLSPNPTHAFEWRESLGPLLLPLALSSLLVQGMGVLLPVFIMVVYDTVIDGQAPVGYHALLAGLVAVLGLEGLLRHMRGRALATAGVRLDHELSRRVVAHLLHLPAAIIERAAVSGQLSRLRGFEVVREVAVSPLILGLMDVPFVILVLAAVAWVAGPLVWVPLMLVGMYVILLAVLFPAVKRQMAKQAATYEERQQDQLEACQHRLELRADGLTEHWLDRLKATTRAASADAERAARQQHQLDVLTQLAGSMAGLFTLATGVGLVLGGTITPGALVAGMMLVWRVLAPLSLLCTALPRLVQLRQTFQQFDKLLEVVPETIPHHEGKTPPLHPAGPGGQVKFHQVALRFSRDHDPVFTGLSFTAEPGQLVNIMGVNGCGKSTLLKLVLGLYLPQSGSVRLDTVDIRQWDAERLRGQIAYLPQQPLLLCQSVAANLRMGNPLASDDQLWHVLEQTGAADAIRRMEYALEHPLPHASALSPLLQGQLAMARLFLHPGRIVLADEMPTAFLAGDLGESYHAWLAQQQGRRTIIAVGNHARLAEMADLAIGLRLGEGALIGPAVKVMQALAADVHRHPTPTTEVFVHAA